MLCYLMAGDYDKFFAWHSGCLSILPDSCAVLSRQGMILQIDIDGRNDTLIPPFFFLLYYIKAV